MTRRILTLAAAVAVAGGFGGSALASGSGVASCARMTLGPRDTAPAVTCVHKDVTMTFATFGDMVEQMGDGC
jgi:hypothetical protein